MAGKVSGSSNRSQSQPNNSRAKTNSSTKTHDHASEEQSSTPRRVRHRSPHGHHQHHGHHAHSPHMEDIQKAELQARQEEQNKMGNGERKVVRFIIWSHRKVMGFIISLTVSAIFIHTTTRMHAHTYNVCMHERTHTHTHTHKSGVPVSADSSLHQAQSDHGSPVLLIACFLGIFVSYFIYGLLQEKMYVDRC